MVTFDLIIGFGMGICLWVCSILVHIARISVGVREAKGQIVEQAQKVQQAEAKVIKARKPKAPKKEEPKNQVVKME